MIMLLRFRAVLFRMVSKLSKVSCDGVFRFRAVLFRMVSKRVEGAKGSIEVLELCCFEWFQNILFI